MNIGEAAGRTGVPVKTIRYYERIGLLPPALRTEAGYRVFDADALRALRFLKAARALDFSLGDCRVLLALAADPARASADVKDLARRHLAGISSKITALQGMQATLGALVEACCGDSRPDCPILDGLMPPRPAASAAPR